MVGKVLMVTTLTSFIFLPFVVAFTLNENAYANFFYVGSVDDKSYFADKQAAMTWSEAKEHCIAGGMAQATVKTIAQKSFLQYAHSSGVCCGIYWTAGRDAQTMQQFVWDGTTDALNGTILTPNSPSGMYTCVYLRYPADYSPYYSGTSCETKYGVLCEVVHG